MPSLKTQFDRYRPAFAPLKAGQYYVPLAPSGAGTSNSLGVAVLRVVPWIVERTITIDRIGAEITTVGEAGSKLRLGIYIDDGTNYPGALLSDAGQIAGDSATVQDAPAVSLTIPPGVYWIGGAVQSVVTTQPTVRTHSGTPPVPLRLGTSLPGAGTAPVGYSQSSVGGALPAVFTTTGSIVGSAPRLHIRAA